MESVTLVEIATVADIPLGRAKAFPLNGRMVAVYHTADGFFATENTCPHRGGPLAEGDLLGNEIVCPWHLWGFDVATGVCTGNPEIAVPKIDLQVEGDRLLVRVP